MRLSWLLFGALSAASGFEARANQTPGPVQQDVADGTTVGTLAGAAVTGEATKPPLPEAPAGEPAHNPHATKFEAAIRLGLSLPFGTVTNSDYFDFTSLNALTLHTLPVAADLGVRISGVVFVGAYFQYAFGASNSTSGSGSSSNVQLGVEVLLHPLGIVAVDPWVGLGAGYEWFNVSSLAADNFYPSAQFKGWELLNVQAGVDFSLGSALKVGPYAAFSIGQYDSFSGNRGTTDSFPLTDKTLHTWLTFGARLVILP